MSGYGKTLILGLFTPLEILSPLFGDVVYIFSAISSSSRGVLIWLINPLWFLGLLYFLLIPVGELPYLSSIESTGYAISFNKAFLSLLLNSSWGLFWPSFTLKVRITEPYLLLVILMRDGSIFKEPVTSLMNLLSPPSSSYFWRVVSSFTVISTELSESLGLLSLNRFCFLEGDALLSWLPLKFWGLFERRECLLFSC